MPARGSSHGRGGWACEAFAPAAPFWAENAYSSPRTGFFSFQVGLAATRRARMDGVRSPT